MPLIRRQWQPGEAHGWSREDAIAAALSAASYLLIILGGALAMVGSLVGVALFLLGAAACAAMVYVIDPKLRAVSADFEHKQREYLECLEKLTRWEH